MSKTIPIRCEAAALLPLDSLKYFQGNLKTLNEHEYKQLRASILKHGFMAPVFVWKDHILDGHQRVFALRKMVEEEGYGIEGVPAAFVQARNKKDAYRKLLQINSHYAYIQEEGLYELMVEAEMELEELVNSFALPDVDMTRFAEGYFVNPHHEGKEYGEDAAEDVRMVECPKCGEEFPV